MITKQLGSNGSNSASNRIILNSDGSVRQVIKPKPFTRTFAAGEILEVSEKVVPEDTAPEVVPDILKGMVFADELSEDELLNIMGLYQSWDDVEIGETVQADMLLSYDGKLYKVIQSHNKQADWIPGAGTDALYTSVMPAGVIGEWEQPPAEDPYMTGDMVTFEGRTWMSTIDNNVWSPASYPAGWEIVE